MARTTIKVAISDDFPILRAGLRMLLSAQPDIEVVGEAGNGAETLGVVSSAKPDVLLLDISMPDTDANQIISKVVKRCARTRIIVLTMHGEPGYLDAALHAGVSGYVLKRALHSDLLRAIRAVFAGEMFVDPRMSKFLVEHSLGPSPRARSSPRVAIGLLTGRETQVLELAARGFLNRQIASRMNISEKSVEKHRRCLLRKLNLRDRADMVEFAIRAGILSSDS